MPLALSMAGSGRRVLVLDRYPSVGQGENKHAIGGVRATHSDPAKIVACLRSLEVFSTWEDRWGDDIEWQRGGYTFPVYGDAEEGLLRGILPIQKKHGLNIDFVGPDRIAEVVPGIAAEGLRGGTHSPDDGSASPLLAANAFYRRACELGVEFRFKEEVRRILVEKGRVTGVATDADTYHAPLVVDAAGAYSRELSATAGVEVPVVPESHEAGITEPVRRFFTTMVVDIRPAPGSKNFYFYQSRRGQVVFCITPDPPLPGTDRRETSTFLPQVARRMVALLPRLRNLRVRRQWRGLYPMTPDGSPLVGPARGVEGLILATGMCGQGFMLGPGVGEVVARFADGKTTESDRIVLDGFNPERAFGSMEALK